MRAQTAIPQAAGAAPLVAFIAVGTSVHIGPVEGWLQVLAWPVVVIAATAIVVGTRFARVVSGVALVCWWMTLAGSLLFVDDGTVTMFGLTTFSAIPILIAFTWGQAWGIHEVQERPHR